MKTIVALILACSSLTAAITATIGRTTGQAAGVQSLLWSETGAHEYVEFPFSSEFYSVVIDDGGTDVSPTVTRTGSTVVGNLATNDYSFTASGVTGGASAQYNWSTSGDVLTVVITITNTSNRTIKSFTVVPTKLVAPSPVTIDPVRSASPYNFPYSIMEWSGGKINGQLELSTSGQKAIAINNQTLGSTKAEIRLINNIGSPGANPPAGTPIAAGESASWTFSYGFYQASASDNDIILPLVLQYGAENPQTKQWPDRRPIGALFIARSDWCSATNPRCYLDSTATDVTTAPGRAALRTKILARAEYTRDQLLSIGAQGVILWDAEGLQWLDATYIGDPTIIEYLAPESSDWIDDVIAVFTDAGLKFGFTVRPQKLLTGNPVPGSCLASQTDQGWVDMSQPYGSQGFRCNGSSYVNGSVFQPDFVPTDYSIASARIIEKITYARSRYGSLLFYLDSNTDTFLAYPHEGFSTINATCQDCLIIPEFEWVNTYASAAPYQDQSTVYGIGSNILKAIPTAGEVRKMTASSFTPSVIAAYANGSASGSILMADSWYPSDALLATPAINSAATVGNSTLSMFNGTQPLSFESNPGTSFTYPLIQRVYFAASSGALSASTTYCQMAGTVTCYLAGVLQPTASLDLSTTPYYQIRYYDFAGNERINNATAGRLP